MNTATEPQTALLEPMAALADPLRARMLLILASQELTVSELRDVFQLPQSTISRHLRALSDTGWVVSRPHGTRRLYRLPVATLTPALRRLWLLTREQVEGTPSSEQDAQRTRAVLAQRRSRSRAFFESEAGRWDHLRDELFGPRLHLAALLGLLDDAWTVADLGCGSGALSEALAPYVARVVAIDGAAAMIEAARRRLADLDNVDVRRGQLEALPLDDAEVDAATLVLVLHHLPDPGPVVSEVARTLRPGGRLLIVDMLPHDRQEYRQEMGHVWLGFSESDLREQLIAAGLRPAAFRALPAEPAARGPALFAATAIRDDRNDP